MKKLNNLAKKDKQDKPKLYRESIKELLIKNAKSKEKRIKSKSKQYPSKL